MDEGLQRVFLDLENLARSGPGIDPEGYRMSEHQLVNMILRNIEKTSPIDLINVLKNHPGSYNDISLFGVLSYLSRFISSLPTPSLLSLLTVLCRHDSQFEGEKKQTMNELLGRIRVGKLTNVEIVELVGFLTPQSEEIAFALGKLREGLVQERENEKKQTSDRLVSVNFHNPLNYLLPGSMDPNFAGCHPPPIQPFRVHQRIGGGGSNGEGEPSSFCFDVEFTEGLRKRIAEGGEEVRSGVDGTILLERECRKDGPGRGKGMVVLVSIPPYTEDVTKYIGSLTQNMTSLSINFAVLCGLFEITPPATIQSVRLGAVIREESYCLDKFHREEEALKTIQPFLLKLPSSSSSSSSSSSLRQSIAPMDQISTEAGVVTVYRGDVRTLRVNEHETFGQLKRRACYAFGAEDPSFFTLQDDNFNVYDSEETVDSAKTPVVRLAPVGNAFGHQKWFTPQG
mmetsp:Transcript_31805/g.49766  ORF Transcript_31805/g.49766 Transcript_31805/m.49766 type:complete len:455 (-) Transcript_31805:67-1431(-)